LIRETKNEADTLALAQVVGRLLKPGDWIALMGELGSGKTVFVKGLAAALHVEDAPTSPTFAIVQTHRPTKGAVTLRHVDLYRLTPAEIPALEWEELHEDSGVTAVEWAEKGQFLWPSQAIPVRITHQGQDARRVEFFVYGSRSEEIIKNLKRLT
jgi:tRNA threonylcarbamoyladenosine biosynthesis protein TsaE